MEIDEILGEIELDPDHQDEILVLSTIFESEFACSLKNGALVRVSTAQNRWSSSFLTELELFEIDFQIEIFRKSKFFTQKGPKSGHPNLVVELSINPSDGARTLSGQERRVCFTLEIFYDQSSRKISAKKCKGISTARVRILEESLKPLDEYEMISDTIERVKDLIYEFNQEPDGECPICLCDMKVFRVKSSKEIGTFWVLFKK